MVNKKILKLKEYIKEALKKEIKKSLNELDECDPPSLCDGCQCCRDCIAQKGPSADCPCCKWCSSGMAIRSLTRERVTATGGRSANEKCSCCKTGYEKPCCRDCWDKGLLPENSIMNEPSIDNMMHEATKNMLNEVQCPCFADGVYGREALVCVDSSNNLQYLVGCCNGRGSYPSPLHIMCNGLACSTIMDGNATSCWDNVSSLEPTETPSSGGSTNIDKIHIQKPTKPTRGDMSEPTIDNMMHEAAANVFCEQEGQDDGEVEVYRVTNQDTGETINVDRNHEMWSEVSKIAQSGNATKGKQLTKGQDLSREDRLDEGILCCMFRKGCCDWFTTGALKLGNNVTVWWSGCCGNSSKGRCC